MIQCCKFEIIYFYQVEEMEDLIANGICNCARSFDEMLQNPEGADDDHESGEEYDEENVDEDRRGDVRRILRRIILVLLCPPFYYYNF